MSEVPSTVQILADQHNRRRHALWYDNVSPGSDVGGAFWREEAATTCNTTVGGSRSSSHVLRSPPRISNEVSSTLAPQSLPMSRLNSSRRFQDSSRASSAMNCAHSGTECSSSRRVTTSSNTSLEQVAKEYDPLDFIVCNARIHSAPLSLDHRPYGVTPLVDSSQPSFVPSAIELWPGMGSEAAFSQTPTSLTNATSVDGTMSRSTSLGDELEMLRIQSALSNNSDFHIPEDQLFSDLSPSVSKSYTHLDANHLVCHTGMSASLRDNFSLSLSMVPQSAQMSPLASQQSFDSLPFDMDEDEHTHYGVDFAAGSSVGVLNELRAHSANPMARQLAPKFQEGTYQSAEAQCRPNSHLDSMSDSVQTLVAASHDRTLSRSEPARALAPISRTPLRRPTREKSYCQKCDKHKRGFRGEHELARHMQRKHSEVRKYWIANDVSEGKTFLANCKHCLSGKKYYAYYNLAAHLRRVHFCKQEKTSRGRRRGLPIPLSERKGGKSGGDKPSIDELRDQGWIKEMDETVLADTSMPDDESEGEDEAPMTGSEGTSLDVAFASGTDPYLCPPMTLGFDGSTWFDP